MRLLIMGPPGAGKGTQAKVIAERLGIPAISTGAIFRAHVEAGTNLGREVADLIHKGNYVPDEVTEQVVAERLAEPDAENGWLLDGFPRTLPQVASLERLLGENRLNAVISLEVDNEKVVKRLLGRARTEGRADDTEETIRHRMDLYTRATQPLLNHYRDEGVLAPVDGDGAKDEVTERILAAVAVVSDRP